MAKRDASSFLPWLLGPIGLYLNGVAVSTPRRETVGIIGEGIVITDDAENDRTNLDFSALTAALAAGAANTILASNGTTTLWQKIVDANVATGAAIAVSKLAAGTNNYVLTTVGGVATWAAAAAGFTAGGDLTGTSTNQTVAKVNGATVPAAGALTAGQILQASGASVLSYVDPSKLIPPKTWNTSATTANQVIYDGTDKPIPANSITRVYETITLKKDGAAEGGTIEMDAVIIRNGTSAPVRIPKSCPCAGPATADVVGVCTTDVTSGSDPTFTDVATVTANGTSFRIFGHGAGLANGGVTPRIRVIIDGTSYVNLENYGAVSSSGSGCETSVIGEITGLSSGSHTIKLQISSGGSTWTIHAGTNNTREGAVLVVTPLDPPASAADPVEYALTGASITATTARYNISGPDGGGNYYLETQITPSTASAIHGEIERDQRSSVLA